MTRKHKKQDRNIGQIVIAIVGGEPFVSNHWNPQLMPRSLRLSTAAQLRLIADKMEHGRFEVDGKWKQFKAPKENT